MGLRRKQMNWLGIYIPFTFAQEQEGSPKKEKERNKVAP